jgi:hypothetical protein
MTAGSPGPNDTQDRELRVKSLFRFAVWSPLLPMGRSRNGDNNGEHQQNDTGYKPDLRPLILVGEPHTPRISCARKER